MNINFFPSPNYNERAHGQMPSLVILHYTGTITSQEAHDIYMMPEKVSPHYMIDRDGSIAQYVAEEKRAWHAGKSFWHGDVDINSSSIGIEIVNAGHEHGAELEPFPDVQIDAVIELVCGIQARWKIPSKNILGHSDIAVGRKIDPGEHFPWEVLEAKGIGLLPKTGAKHDDKSLPDLFREWGYDIMQPLDMIKKEFCRHYLRHSDLVNPDERQIRMALLSLLQQAQ
jgi:N-acetylmuramoyl-L-alanine amidase